MVSKLLNTLIIIATGTSSLIAQALPARPQRFDHFTFVVPGGYVTKKGKTFVDFLKYNDTKTAYAEITFYRARPGTSDLQAEFITEWNTLVKKTKGVDPPTPSSSEIENGWVSTFGTAPVKVPEGRYIQTLITFVGNNLVATISVRATGETFAKEIQSILESVEVEKPTVKID